ncbi:ferric reductase-like transmembrane domain-containing protein [Chromatocurvus halotolerans]|nr:ferric reductase-like transmembrane domain-containing protein [Chromatocurvus halotolerans]
MVAFAALLVDFLFSGRTRWISDRIGVRRTLRIHRWVAYAIISCIALHPFLYTAPDGVSWPWFNANDPTLILGNWSLFTGLAAWILTAGIILIAVDHRKLPGSYRAWRLMHAGSALLLGTLIAVHAISADGYSGQTGLAVYWILLLCVGLLILIEMFLVQPWRRRLALRRKHEHPSCSGNRPT